MVGDAVLGIVIGADFFGAIAGFDLAPAFGADGGLLLFEFHFVEAGKQKSLGLGAGFSFGFLLPLRADQGLGQTGASAGGIFCVHSPTAAAARDEGRTVEASVF